MTTNTWTNTVVNPHNGDLHPTGLKTTIGYEIVEPLNYKGVSRVGLANRGAFLQQHKHLTHSVVRSKTQCLQVGWVGGKGTGKRGGPG